MKLHKKSQIALFIIVGMLLLIGVGLFIYYQNIKVNLTVEKPVEVIGTAAEVKQYVDSCLTRSVLTGLDIIRLQGGYIDLPAGVETFEFVDPEGKTVIEEDGTKKIVQSYGRNKMPIWYDKNNRLNTPSLDQIKNQFENFIENDLLNCVDGFKVFEEKGVTVKDSYLSANVSFDKIVDVDLDYELEIQSKDGISYLNRFVYSVPIDFKRLRSLAYGLTQHEFIVNYMEDRLKYLISVNSGKNSEKLPPYSFTDLNFDCSYVVWDENSVESNLAYILSSNLPYLKVKNSNFERLIGKNVYQQSYYDSFVEDIGLVGNYQNYQIAHVYRPEFGFDKFDVKPDTGKGIKKPFRVSQLNVPFLPQICTFRYEYKYDVAFTTLVVITDTASAKVGLGDNFYIKNGGYTFYYPISVVICGNNERTCTGLPNYTNQIKIDYSALETYKSHFCDSNQRVSGNVTISVKDYNQSILDGTDIYYYCGSEQNDCFIGRTNEFGEFTGKMPYCVNGMIHFEKPGYATGYTSLTVNNASNLALSYDLEKKREFNVSVKLVLADNLARNALFGEPLLETLPNNQELVNINLREDNIGYYSSQGHGNLSFGSLTLSSGYTIFDSNVQGNIVIKQSEYRYENGSSVNISYNENGGDYNGKWILGAIDNYEWQISKDEIAGKSKVEFIIPVNFRADSQLTFDEMINATIGENKMLKIPGYNVSFDQYKYIIRPRFS